MDPRKAVRLLHGLQMQRALAAIGAVGDVGAIQYGHFAIGRSGVDEVILSARCDLELPQILQLHQIRERCSIPLLRVSDGCLALTVVHGYPVQPSRDLAGHAGSAEGRIKARQSRRTRLAVIVRKEIESTEFFAGLKFAEVRLRRVEHVLEIPAMPVVLVRALRGGG